MYIKRYTLASFLLIAFIGWYVYAYISQASIAVELFGIVLPAFSIAIWVVVPLVILYFASVLHMSFYSLLSGLRLRKYNKDYEKMMDAIADAYLAKAERNHIFKTPRYKLLGTIIDSATLSSRHSMKANTKNEKLDAVIKLIEDVKNGEVVELKKYSLKPNNALVIQNDKNRYKKGDISASNILNNSSDYDESLTKDVYIDFVQDASLSNIESHKSFLSIEALFVIISRINAEENRLEISNEILISFFDTLEIDAKELIEISIALSSSITPEQRMKLFETLSDKREDAVESYLFTLFDLEMLSPANELLENTQRDEYLNFKAYSALKECGKNFNINLFI